jgi:hypothetical protein
MRRCRFHEQRDGPCAWRLASTHSRGTTGGRGPEASSAPKTHHAPPPFVARPCQSSPLRDPELPPSPRRQIRPGQRRRPAQIPHPIIHRRPCHAATAPGVVPPCAAPTQPRPGRNLSSDPPGDHPRVGPTSVDLIGGGGRRDGGGGAVDIRP